MNIFERLREERERLGLSQERFGAIGGVLKRAQIHYEKGERMPDASYLAAIADRGADVLYVLTGQRSSAMPAVDAAEQVLLDSYRRCGDPARQTLIQTAALLAAGVGAPAPSPSVAPETNAVPTSVQVSATGGHAAGRDVNVNQGAHEPQPDIKPRRARRRA